MQQLLEWIGSLATSLIDTFGLLGIFIGMILESACIPLPSEVILLTGGFFAANGTFPLWGVIAAGVIGNLIGSVLIYWVGAKRARTFLEKYGRYVLLSQKHLDKADAWFSRYGDWAAFIGRILPFIRTFISLPAGIARMNFSKFCLYTFLGCIPWNIALAYLGYGLGANWKKVEAYLHPISYALLLLFVLAVLRFLFQAYRQRKEKGIS
ncbi:DedA family protein [Gorillibacterium timonense]|uniref:DedA family protein n=1 Tax=Gorillibacterium timonense TaxID=1689269 RepID=UPI00071D41A5|nr:DedA family protein [Gorillibacterium timonense]